MAMINCPECGHEISSRAMACPHCGNPINMKQEIPVEITRLSKFSGGGVKFALYLDGIAIGKLSNGESMTVNVMQGNHQLDIDALSVFGGNNGHSKAALYVPDDASRVHVEIAMGMTGPSVKDIYAE